MGGWKCSLSLWVWEPGRGCNVRHCVLITLFFSLAGVHVGLSMEAVCARVECFVFLVTAD